MKLQIDLESNEPYYPLHYALSQLVYVIKQTLEEVTAHHEEIKKYPKEITADSEFIKIKITFIKD